MICEQTCALTAKFQNVVRNLLEWDRTFSAPILERGARHAKNHRSLFILRQTTSPGATQLQHPIRTIASHSCQHYRHASFGMFQSRIKENLHRWAMPIAFISLHESAEERCAPIQFKVETSPRREIDMSLRDGRSIGCQKNLRCDLTIETLGETRQKTFRHMLGDKRRWAVFRKGFEKSFQRVDTTSRGSDENNFPIPGKLLSSRDRQAFDLGSKARRPCRNEQIRQRRKWFFDTVEPGLSNTLDRSKRQSFQSGG
ncbi:hypothetical protein TP2_09740 [Thioclava pacifica DSM 10166]|uniref:Uncharacterized protein n=1 Tax=Thioclava pacifica DSM 10166 TaxID=1353537 RepID=A0A074J7A9_9RHOB|nr:hypothetical protein TP2_09740 [Thioclava pacifica DSM 10166]